MPPRQRQRSSHRERDAARVEADAASARRGQVRRWAVSLFLLLSLAYWANGSFLQGNDATANVWLAERVIDHGSLFFSPEDTPFMFTFEVPTDEGMKKGRFRSWDLQTGGKSMREHYQAGTIRLSDPIYYLAPTRWSGLYANTFGLGAGLLAVPAAAVVRPFVGPLAQSPTVMWYVGKLVAAATVAGSAVFLFLAALSFCRPLTSFVLALAYGLGTCVWSTSSQSLWQHGPLELFMAMAVFFLLRRDRDLWCGLACGLAVACRPTGVLLTVAIGLFHLLGERRRLLRFVMGGLPVAVLLIAYAWIVFGSPFSLGQWGVGTEVAQAKTGNPDVWQTPLHVGALGLLFSPARGLLVYSPIALVGLWGLVRAWRQTEAKAFRPLTLAAVAMFLMASKWFDWWGGWCFGYRPIVDVTTLLAFLAIPVAEKVRDLAALRWSFAGLFLWSVGVQVLGAYAYDVTGWNGRAVYDVILPADQPKRTFDDSALAASFARERGGRVEPRSLSVDDPIYRSRLWSVTDNPIGYYLLEFSSSRKRREEVRTQFLRHDG